MAEFMVNFNYCPFEYAKQFVSVICCHKNIAYFRMNQTRLSSMVAFVFRIVASMSGTICINENWPNNIGNSDGMVEWGRGGGGGSHSIVGF